LLLLDGLDEVAREHQESCVESINRFAKEFGFPGIAVCCRLQQYGDLNVKLSLNGAICLRPLSDAQIDSYVKDAGADLAGLRTAIQQDESIRELARSPLMLNLMCITYRGYEPESLASREKPEDRSNHLFTTYIDKMFAKRGTSELTYSREKTLGWLSWIARRLYERSQAMFLIEGLQPSCLCGRRQRWAYLALFSVTLGVLMGFASIAHRGAGTFNEVVDPQNFAFLRPREWIMWLTVTPAWVLAYSWIENLGIRSGKPFLERAPAGMWRAAVKCVVSASIWLIVAWSAATLVLLDGNLTWDVLPAPFYWSGVALSIVLGALGRNRSVSYSIRTIETFRWSIKDAQRGALLGFIFGAIIGTPILVFEELRQKMPDASSWWIPILGFAIVGLGTGAMFGGLKPHVNDSKTTPNQGIRLSSRSSVLMALNAIWLVAIAAFIANAGGYVYTPNPAWTLNGMGVPMLGNFVGLFTVLILWFGGLDVVKHYVLRAVLSMSGNTPWNLARFLDQVQDLNLMQSAGNAYIFVHRRLRDFLATGSRVNTPE
jgi:hypothetical protein